MKAIINVEGLEKDFNMPKKIRRTTFWSKVKEVFYRENEVKKILHNISFKVNEGEFIGYVGPNGAGKSTTIKILTGVLSPTKGSVEVAGFSPFNDRYKYTFNIGVVFGHRTLLEFNIPVRDSFLLYKDIYEISDADYNKRLAYFSKTLKIDSLMHIPVRKLSLGQRMRCEIAASLLHKPKVVFLDEPTIGLDAVAKEEIREFLRKINREEKTTILLTTHDMDDIEALCKRIIIIDNGKNIYDGPLENLKKKYIRHKTIELDFKEILDKRKFNSVIKDNDLVIQKDNFISLRVDITKKDLQKVIAELLKACYVVDLLVHEPRLEHIIREIYDGK